MLLLLLLLHNAIASDYSNVANYTIRGVAWCPDQGYFFRQELGVNDVEPTHCYLCFCKGDGVAVCWQRNKALCDKKGHRNVESDPRSRRSSVIVTDNPSRKPAVKFHSHRATYKCKPIGSSMSKDCPPDDWCHGCTLCDCDSIGRWSCHILSICSDKQLVALTEKASTQKQNDTVKRCAVKIHPKPEGNKTKPKVHKYVKKLHTSHKCEKCLKARSNEFLMAEPELSLPRHDDTIVVIEKDLVGRTPMEVQGVRVKKVIHDNRANIKLAHKIVQRAMAAVHKIIIKNEKNITNVTKLFKVQKRSMSLGDDQTNHQPEYMSPHMYMKSNSRKFWKQVSVNQKKFDNYSGSKQRVRRNILHQALNITPREHPKNSFNSPINKTLQSVLPENKSKEFNELQYFKYNVLETKSPITKKMNKSTPAGIIDLDHFTVKSGYVNFSKNNSALSYRPSAIKLTERKSTFSLEKTNFSKANKKKKQTDKKVIDLIDVILKRKGTSAQNVSEKANLYDYLPTRNNFMTHLISLLKKIFSNSKKSKSFSRSNLLKRLTKQNLLEIFCTKNFSCNIRPIDEVRLQIKINDLNSEIYKILETTKIMHKILVEMDFKRKRTNYKKSELHLLKKKVVFSKNNGESKVDQLQLYYLKDSFNTFVQNVEQFSNTLRDIIYILTGKEITKKMPRRPLRCTNSSTISFKSNRIIKTEKNLEKLKMILLNLKVFQSTFIESIYDILTKIELNLSSDKKRKKVETTAPSSQKELNNIYHLYPKNISEKLKKPKKMVKRLSATHRNKRNAMRDDDAIEYLLVLMEHLLKQNYPLDAAPVNDGIDLLIDAIKHAPDIRPAMKKASYNSLTTLPATRTTPRVIAATFAYVDNIYGIDSSEKSYNDTSHSDDNQIDFTPGIDGDERLEDVHKLLQDSKKILSTFDMPNLSDLYKEKQIDPVTSSPIFTVTPLIRYDFYNEDTAGQVNFDKYVKPTRKFEGHGKDGHLEDIKYDDNELNKGRDEILEYAPILTPATESDLIYTISYPTRTMAVSTTRKFHHMPKDKFKNSDVVEYKRKKTNSKFGWIDYDQEENGSKLFQRESVIKITSTTTAAPKKNTDVNDVSSITKEFLEEVGERRFSKMLPSAMFSKLNLINPKEGGARKFDLDSESKEVEHEETYVNDIFPSYFT